MEAFCWGAGTAIGEEVNIVAVPHQHCPGELPPYFMARAARLSGGDPAEETEELRLLQEKEGSGQLSR